MTTMRMVFPKNEILRRCTSTNDIKREPVILSEETRPLLYSLCEIIPKHGSGDDG